MHIARLMILRAAKRPTIREPHHFCQYYKCLEGQTSSETLCASFRALPCIRVRRNEPRIEASCAAQLPLKGPLTAGAG